MTRRAPTLCKCGCGEMVKPPRTAFVDKSHQLDWMTRGGGAQMQALLPDEVLKRGGHVSGKQAAESGRLREASEKGVARSREIAAEFRAKRGGKR